MAEGILGGAALLAAVILAGFAAALSAVAGIRDNKVLAAVGRRAIYGVCALLAVASGTLLAALLTHDFGLAYVVQHSDVDTPAALAASAFYSGQEGSLLYWTLVTAVLGGVAVTAAARIDLKAAAFATAVLGALVGLLAWILAFVADPFDLLVTPARDGFGLNPLLRDGGMLVHPPFLLAGLASFSAPFVLVAGALIAGRVDPLLGLVRRFALLSWGLLSIGLTLGMWWAYHVLGWGGYWGWDPVENAALMPWLVATALLHLRRRSWTVALVLGGFNLALLGTFIVRSGVVPSVHSFAVSPAGPWFFALLAAGLAVSLLLGVARAGRLGTADSDRPLDGPLVLSGLLLLAAVGVILWGSLLPLAAGLFTGAQAAADPAFYDRAAGPLLLGVILVLLAFGPRLLRRRRRVGAYLAHVGILVVAAGVAASQLGHFERDLVLRPGQQVTVAGHTVAYAGARAQRLDHGHVQTLATLTVDGAPLQPGRVVYPDFGGQSDALVAIRPSVVGDIYVVLGGVQADGRAAFLFAVNPLVDWIWAGAALLIAGVLSGRLRAPVRAAAPARITPAAEPT